MIILSNYRIPQSNNTIWCLFNGRRMQRLTPEDIPAVISDLIDRAENEHVYINDFSMYIGDILDVLYIKEYSPIKGNPPIKRMSQKSFKYLINGDFNAYSITTVKKRNSATHFVNANNMISINSNKMIISTWTGPEDGDDAERLARGFYRAISGVLRDIGAERRLPVTISGACRRAWNTSLDGQIYQLLHNANTVKVSNETLEKYCRRAYHGGLCLKNSEVNDDIKDGIVLDVNSLYPYIMKTRPMPRGEAHFCKGRPTPEILRDARDGYVYFFVRIKTSFSLKDNGIPCVQLSSDNPERFLHKRGWLETSRVYNYHEDRYMDTDQHSILALTLTQTDFDLFLKNYDVKYLSFIDYVWFTTTTVFFEGYVDHYFNEKQRATSAGERRIKKMMLNGLSGNMARLPLYENINIVETSRGFEYEYGTSEGSKSYVYVGSAITSYAREYLINYINKCRDRWLYSDTDSIHLRGTEVPEGFKVSDELGDWKIEKQFDAICYYGRKMYGYHDATGYHFTLAGINREDTIFYSRILNGMSEDDALQGLDIVQPSLYQLKDFEADAIDNQFTDELSEDDIDTLRKLEKKAGARARRAYYIYDVVAKKENPLQAFYFCRLPVTIRKHGDSPFCEKKVITWKQINEIEVFY